MRAWIACCLLTAAPTACAAEPVRVRADAVAAPCLSAVLKAAGGGGLVVADGPADLLIAAASEVARAVESGTALEDGEIGLARVPFVLVVPAGNPLGLRGLDDVARAGGELAVLDLPAAHEARRAAEAAAPGRVRLQAGERARRAPLALVPLSLAGEGEKLPTGLRPLELRGAVLAAARDPQAARALLARLARPPAVDAWARCQ
ncbi:MAG: substrate-binding domain-containing protein [Vicinamibacteria bacterium]|nr:substrate-binding domain-containing protein [Vicinamibacteria bacterium]